MKFVCPEIRIDVWLKVHRVPFAGCQFKCKWHAAQKKSRPVADKKIVVISN